jgi:purine-binding chemotaxis protein CheW
MAQMLVFGLGPELYGLDVTNIQEIVERPVLHYIPRTPAQMLGAINFHGSIIPVLDLGSQLGFPPETAAPRVVVLPPQLCALALAVRSIRRIVAVDGDSLIPVDPERQAESFIRAVCHYGGEVVNILDLPRLLAVLEKQTKS